MANDNPIPGEEGSARNESEEAEINSSGSKREDFIDWQTYFMATAFLAAKRSKDPKTQVGACIVNQQNRIVGVGYNGFPNGCPDDQFPWTKSSEPLKSKHSYVCHAELNAVLNKNCSDVHGCTIFVGLFPCNECAKVIIQAGIKEVVYYSDKHGHKESTIAAKKMFQSAGVNFRCFVPERKKIEIDFSEINKSHPEALEDNLNKLSL